MLVEYLSVPRRKGTRPCTIVRTRTGADLWSCGDDCRWSPSSAAATLILRASRAGAAIADGVAEERTANAGSLVVSLCDAAIAAHTVLQPTQPSMLPHRDVLQRLLLTRPVPRHRSEWPIHQSRRLADTHTHTRARAHTHQHKLGRRKEGPRHMPQSTQ